MALNISSFRVADIADLPIKNADGSPLVDPETGEPVTATICGPGHKVWQVADAAKRRKAIKRSREANGKFEAALDNEDADNIDFLCAITKRFNHLDYEDADGNAVHGDRETVRAVYADPLLGFIRDHLMDDTRNWENFMKASQALPNSGSDNSHG